MTPSSTPALNNQQRQLVRFYRRRRIRTLVLSLFALLLLFTFFVSWPRNMGAVVVDDQVFMLRANSFNTWLVPTDVDLQEYRRDEPRPAQP